MCAGPLRTALRLRPSPSARGPDAGAPPPSPGHPWARRRHSAPGAQLPVPVRLPRCTPFAGPAGARWKCSAAGNMALRSQLQLQQQPMQLLHEKRSLQLRRNLYPSFARLYSILMDCITLCTNIDASTDARAHKIALMREDFATLFLCRRKFI
jgi:hypothetical protein